jgi:hypothetical protein
MKIANVRQAVLACVLASAAVPAVVAIGPVAAHAQQVVCNPGTGAFFRAVGPQNNPNAQILVPVQVPLTICSSNGTVVGVIPAFRTVGPAAAPIIVPTVLPVRTCAPTVATAVPVVGGGVQPALQFTQVGSGVVVLSGGTMVTVSTAFTCF